MGANEMRYEFLIGYDKLTNLAAPGYEDAEISVLLSQAQEEYIKAHYHPAGNKYRQGFEYTEKRRKDLGELVRTANISQYVTDLSDNHTYGKFFELPDELWLTIEESAYINFNILDCSTLPVAYTDTDRGNSTIIALATPIRGAYEMKNIYVKPVSHDEYNVNILNPFKKPNRDRVWRLDYSTLHGYKIHELITDGTYEVVKYFVRYISKPSAIVVDINVPANQMPCMLDSMTHREIVDIAVRIATSQTNQPEYPVKIAEENKTE